MAKKRFKLNRKGVREILQSQEMLEVCVGYAEEIAGRAGSGYVVDTQMPGKTRVNASIHAGTREAIRDNLENNTLLKAVRG